MDLVLPAIDWALNELEHLTDIQNIKEGFYYKSPEVKEKTILMDLKDAEDFFGETFSKEITIEMLRAYDFLPLNGSKETHLNVLVPMSRFWDVKNEMGSL